MSISPDLLKIIACPKCRGEVRLNEAQDAFLCTPCRLRYRIENDIPIMLIDEAEPLD